MRFDQISTTDDRSAVSRLIASPGRGVMLFWSDTGDTYVVGSLPTSPAGHGPRDIFSSALDGNGVLLEGTALRYMYELYSMVASAADDGTYSVLAQQTDAHSAQKKTVVTGTYVSGTLDVSDDFGYWKSIFWTQTCTDSRVVVAVKTGLSAAEVQAKDWERWYEAPCGAYYGYGGQYVERDLDFFNLRGSRLMFKVELTTEVADNPVVRQMGVSYVGKHCVYFFTNKIRIDGSRFGEAILTVEAGSTTPKMTEVRFAFGPGESTDWKDYVPVDIGRMASVPDAWGKRMRVGIRMSSLDTSSAPVVHGFALEFESDAVTQVNKDS